MRAPDGSELHKQQQVNGKKDNNTEIAADLLKPSKTSVSASSIPDKYADADGKRKTRNIADPSEHSKPHPLASAPQRRDVSESSVENERYSLGTQPCSDHDNEDKFIVHSNKYSLCMCVFDGHDGSRTVKFMKCYMDEQVFGISMWTDITKSSKPEKIEAALANYIQKADDNFFKTIEPFIRESQKLQSKIPKVT